MTHSADKGAYKTHGRALITLLHSSVIFLQETIWQVGRMSLAHVPSETGPLLPELIANIEGAELLFGPQASGSDSSPEYQAWQVKIFHHHADEDMAYARS